MNHARLYQNELTRLGYGNPVWEPNPDRYDRVRIGDVGYFENDQFMPLFNILPLEDSNRIPFPQPNFEVLDIPDNYPTSHRRNPLQAGVHGLESSLTFSAAVGVDRQVYMVIKIARYTGFIVSQCWVRTPRRVFYIVHQKKRCSTHSTI